MSLDAPNVNAGNLKCGPTKKTRTAQGEAQKNKALGTRRVPRLTPSSQQGLLLRLRVRDLVDQDPNTALRDDVGHGVTELNGDHRLGATDVHHGEQIDHWVCAPTDHSPDLRSRNVRPDARVLLLIGGIFETDEELLNDVQEEGHGEEPARPTSAQVTCDGELSVVAGGNHERRSETKGLGLRVVLPH